MRTVDGAVARRWVLALRGAGFHGVLCCVVGAVKAGPEDGSVGTLVVAVGDKRVDEDVGGCTRATPYVGEIAGWVCGR